MGAPSCGPGVQDAPPREAIQTPCPRNPAGPRHCSPRPELRVLEALPQEGTRVASPPGPGHCPSHSSLGATSLGGDPGTQEGPRRCPPSAATFQPGALGRGGDLGTPHPHLFTHPQLWVMARRGPPGTSLFVSPSTQPWVGSLRHHLPQVVLSSPCSQRVPAVVSPPLPLPPAWNSGSLLHEGTTVS